MNLRKTLPAASIAAIPMLVCGTANAGSLMGAPAVQSQQDNASLIGQLNSQRGSHGLDSRHGFKIATQHPGTTGTLISRVDHTFKGVRIFQSESVIVTGPHGSIISESIADRRSGLNKGDMSVNASISAKAAIDGALRSLAARGAQIDPPLVAIDPPSAELIVYPVMQTVRVAGAANKAEADLNAVDLEDVVTGYQLAYLVHTRMAKGRTPVYQDSIVSAADGSVIDQWSAVQTVVGTGNSQYNGISTTARRSPASA